MKSYYRIMLGKGSIYAEEAHGSEYIGAGWLRDTNLSNQLPDEWRQFNKEFIPIYLKENPDKTKIAAGLACGMLYTIAKGILKGDVVFCPNGSGDYYIGEVVGDYEYHKDTDLPHRRSVKWFPELINRDDLSLSIRNSMGSIGTVSNITKYSNEIELLISGNVLNPIMSTDQTVEDPSMFALEKHLEDFLVKNWQQTELGKKYDIYKEDDEIIGQQYPSDTGPIDILAVSKDRKEILIVELKKGRASDSVVGQIQRYMGYVKSELAEKNQTVKGVIIAFEDDIKIQRALSVTNDIEFYTYKLSFKLEKK